jgi:hypothetical protein
MSSQPSQDPSFRLGAEPNDSLSVMTRLRAAQAFESQEPSQLDGAVEELIERNLDSEGGDWSEVARKVMRGVVESISDQEDADWAIRRASHRAVLAVAKRWGNVVLAGKATVVGTREAAGQAGLDCTRAAQQAGLGAIEGVLQVGPVAYPVLQREISPMVEDLQEVLDEERRSGEWMLRSLERSTLELPVLPEDEPESVALNLAADDYSKVDWDVELPPPPDLPLGQAPAPIETPKENQSPLSLVSAKPEVEASLKPSPEKPVKPVGFFQRAWNWVKSWLPGR